MTRQTTRGGPRADKRRAILEGALTVFARDGYTRASIDAISAEAGVSTRTIYNHFADKARLFETVIQESAARIAAQHIAVIERHLDKIVDLEADLVEFGRAWASSTTAEEAAHFALVQQVNAEAGHIPPSALEAWQRTGPLRVRAELAERLRRMADRGLLRVTDPDRSALHLMLLIGIDNPSLRFVPLTEREIEEMVTAGVRTFLYGHAPR
ncbi:TetR/AcrR family transcriptional regulator [Thermomonospora cellulosilytica]|uniref:AcrR family transcriptional regulator n=1 Tax=Thermomonospora cellulosilytica TaxID=1411118 RepID=A0A7W3MT35_9ACTN|nr:TetR/AcrR family transcriptional regulator [Thermomonospora cellulosilytica]MBA9001388.1 AcrR family transcriptional regulator [Thermomonospora cellulosilytica]